MFRVAAGLVAGVLWVTGFRLLEADVFEDEDTEDDAS